jgi:hypothetical protein
LAAFVNAHDPEMMADKVTMIEDTLMRAARIQEWLRRYIAALKLRRVQ